MTEFLREDQVGAVVVFTFDRPQRRNALGEATVTALRDRLRQLDADVSVGAIILTGSPPGFCAGSDLKELGQLSLEAMGVHEAQTAALARELSVLRKPVLAAVEGFALGGGFIFALACDVVVTGRSVRWHLPEVTIGWLPPWGLEALVDRVGVATARRVVWGDLAMDGVEAHRLGVADVLAEDGQALAAARVLAERLAALPAEAVAATKLYFATMSARDGETADRLASRLFLDNCHSAAALATLRKFGARQ